MRAVLPLSLCLLALLPLQASSRAPAAAALIASAPDPPTAVSATYNAAFYDSAHAWLDPDKVRGDRIAAWWAAIRRWVASEFDRRGADTVRHIAQDAGPLDLHLTALPLGGGAVLVAAGDGRIDTFFVLRSVAGHYRTVWNGADLAHVPHAPEFRSLVTWDSGAVQGHCPVFVHCGPLGVDAVGLLPPDSRGRARLYLLGADHPDMVTGPRGAQLSIWRWDGNALTPLFLRNVRISASPTDGTVFQGNMLNVRVARRLDHMNACGPCTGAEADRRVRISGDRITDLGEQSRAPELDLVDRLVDRLAHRKSTFSLAAPRVAAQMRRAANDFVSPWSLGMVNDWRVRHVGQRTSLCLSSDGLYPRIFTIVRARLVAIRQVSLAECASLGPQLEAAYSGQA